MKKTMMILSLMGMMVSLAYGGTNPPSVKGKITHQTTVKREVVAKPTIPKTTIDPITVSRAEAMINQKKLLWTELFTSNVVDQAGNIVEKNFVRYHFRQAGVEWDEVKERIEISGRVGPKRYSKLKLLYAAEQAGKAGQLKDLLSSQTTPSGLTFWDLFNAAMYLKEDDENLMAGLKLAVQSGLCTQAQLDAILESALD